MALAFFVNEDNIKLPRVLLYASVGPLGRSREGVPNGSRGRGHSDQAKVRRLITFLGARVSQRLGGRNKPTRQPKYE
jgi:hypothetical protein